MAERLRDLGCELLCTAGTTAYLSSRGIVTQRVNKVAEGRPHVGIEALRESLLQVTALRDLATGSLAGCKSGV